MPNTGFTLWEVQPVSGSAGEHTSIADNWGFSVDGRLAYVQILMPTFSGVEYTSPAVDGNVYVKGSEAPNPDGRWSVLLNPGTLGDATRGGGSISYGGEVGGGGRDVVWADYTIPDPANPQKKFPPGMFFIERPGVPGNVTVLMNRPSGPTEIGTFTFTLGINLPGSMRIQRDFTYTVNAVPDILLGDVDGDDFVTLVDLILLSRFLLEPEGTVILNNPDAAFIVPPFGDRPRNADLIRLAEHFANGRSLR
jgi:hypothetical protein